MLTLKEQHERSSEDVSRLQQQVKEANEDYRRRLWRYVQDIAVSSPDDTINRVH